MYETYAFRCCLAKRLAPVAASGKTCAEAIEVEQACRAVEVPL
jgi:hypothetical protein